MIRKHSIVLFVALLAFMMSMGAFIYRVEMSKSEGELSDEMPVENEIGDEEKIKVFQTERQQLRQMQKAQLNDLIHDSQTEAELKSMAQRQLMDMCKREEAELTLEGMLRLRGWENALVNISKNCVNVIIPTEVITQHESSVILETVCRETGMESGNVKIIPIN